MRNSYVRILIRSGAPQVSSRPRSNENGQQDRVCQEFGVTGCSVLLSVCGQASVDGEFEGVECLLRPVGPSPASAASRIEAHDGQVHAFQRGGLGAGYTKGAIYKHFSTKEDLFWAVSDRYWRRYFDNFAEVMSSARQIGAPELDEIAQRWRQLSRDRGAEHAALGHEFALYLLRNPDARERVAARRSEVVEALGKFVVEGVDRLGGDLRIPPMTFAQVLIATSDVVVLGSELDDVDLHRPIVEMYVSAIKLP